MTQPIKLMRKEVWSIEQIEIASKDPNLNSIQQLVFRQLLDTMRENELLKAHPLKLICEKCNAPTEVKW